MAIRAIVLFVSALGCGSSNATSSPSAPTDLSKPAVLIGGNAVYSAGEYLKFRLRWKGFAGGSNQVITGQPGVEAGQKAIVIRSITATEGLIAMFKALRDELTTVINTETGAPISSQNAIELGRELRRIDVAFADRSFTLEHVPPDNPRESWKQTVPPDGPRAHDLHSVLAHLRAWKPPLGTRGYCYVQSGREFFRFELQAAGIDNLETVAGEFEALRFEGVAIGFDRSGAPASSGVKRVIKFWISTGDQRIPVKLLSETQYGDLSAELIEYRRGKPLR